ncbi:hypothetical protein ACS0TY_018063 [Phlomoides rotata]
MSIGFIRIPLSPSSNHLIYRIESSIVPEPPNISVSPFSPVSSSPPKVAKMCRGRLPLAWLSVALKLATRVESVYTGGGVEINDDDFLPERPELQLQGVNPRKGWNFHGVHRAIICGKVCQAPVQKILRSGRTVTTFSMGTGGMFDQRTICAGDIPKPAQWHRIAVHNSMLGAYVVQQIVKNSSVYVEGEIETHRCIEKPSDDDHDSEWPKISHLPNIMVDQRTADLVVDSQRTSSKGQNSKAHECRLEYFWEDGPELAKGEKQPL